MQKIDKILGKNPRKKVADGRKKVAKAQKITHPPPAYVPEIFFLTPPVPIAIFEHFQLSDRYEIYETLIEIRSS